MNGFDLSTISAVFVGSNKYSAIYKGSTLIFRDYSAEYLTFESLEDGNTIGFKAYSDNTLKTIEYSTDKTNWTSVTSSSSGTTIATLNTGDKLYLKGDNNAYCESSNYNYFTSTKTFNVYGNIMSLISSSTFKTLTTLTVVRALNSLFMNSKIVNASNLILPATTLTENCYQQMFQNCTSLTTAPELPATTLANRCYSYMFYGCTSLTTAPNLPAITLTNLCYFVMFNGCSSLVNAPIISATTLADTCCSQMFRNCTSLETAPTLLALTLTTQCYFQMFNGCTKLNYVKMLATDISASNCMYNWLNSVSSTGTFVKNSAATWTKSGASGIPANWTVQTASS